ncbi:MAG TPA: LysR substrate-binding domain-containing protein [Roseomonas sp.]|jgi:DNA-binding transcriptional LysR family regulator
MAARIRISPRQLEAFRAFMEVGTVTGAAERLRLSQPAVSKILSGLEYSVGYPLFLREKRRLVPTREARLLQREVDRIFRGLDELDGFVRDIRALDQGELHMLSTPALGEVVLPDVMAAFLRRHRDVRVTFQVRHSEVIAQRVVDQQTDLGFSMVPFDHPSIHSEELFQVPAVCVLPAGHRLAACPVIRPEDLRGESFLSFARDARMRHLVDAVFEARQIDRVMRHEIYSSLEACSMAARGIGVAIVEPLTAMRMTQRGLVMRPFEPRIHYSFRVMRPRFRDPSRLAEAFLDAVRAWLQETARSGAIQGLVLPRGSGGAEP